MAPVKVCGYIFTSKGVNCAGLEPATPALSRQCSEPTELTVRDCKYRKMFEKLYFCIGNSPVDYFFHNTA